MHIRKLAVAAIAIAALSLGSGAQAGPRQVIGCPADIRAEVTSPLPPEWVATAQSSAPVSVSIEPIGGENALVCKYRLFGTDYMVWRRPPAGYTRCFTHPVIFICDPT